MLHSEREPIDAPAIYFVMPNKDNINRICKDISDDLYQSFYLNFVSSISKPLLEYLAQSVLESDSVNKIEKVFDQYCNFISLEDYMFSLGHENSYISFNDPRIDEIKAQENVQKTVNSLFGVILSLGVVPIIQCPKGGPAEMIARQLDQTIREHINSIDNVLDGSSWNRPVLVLLDRSIDLSVMVAHTWSYQTLIHDLLSYNLNRVKMEVEEEDKKSGKKVTLLKSFDIDCNEPFFAPRASSPFPNVAVEIQQAVDEIKNTIKRHTEHDSKKNEDEEVFSRTKNISEFVSSIPEVQEKKRVLDMHTTVAYAILEKIKERHLDEFFSLEETIMTKPALQHKKEVINLISSNKGDLNDKLRLFLIYYMSKQNEMDPSEIKEFEELLESKGIDTKPFKYLRKINAFNESWSTLGSSPSQSGKGKDFIKTFKGLFSSSVQYLLPANKDFSVTRIIDAITELKETNDIGQYLYFDPKFTQQNPPRKKTPFKEAIVFMVGGGNYIEMQNIQEYVKRYNQNNPGTIPKKIIYGTTEVVNANNFIEQLSKLHELME